MATINVRVDDDVHERLRQLADEDGKTLSDLVRDLLLEAVHPIEHDHDDRGDELAPDSMRLIDRQILATLHRILGRVLPENGADGDGDLEYQLMRAKILEDGFTGEYWYEVSGFRTELSKRDSRRVLDILQMFRIITYSGDRLVKAGKKIPGDVQRRTVFKGFDHNDLLEGHMADYVKFLTKDGDRWSELRPQIEAADGGNSHHEMLDIYLRMLTEYRKIMDKRVRRGIPEDYLLSLADLERLAEAWVEPSRRG